MSKPELKVVVTLDGKAYYANLDNLDKKTDEFGDTAQSTGKQVDGLGKQTKALGDTSKKATKKVDKLGNETVDLGKNSKETALTVGHLKGVVGLLAGAFAAVNLANIAGYVLDVNKEFDSLRSTLVSLEGSQSAALTAFEGVESLAANSSFQVNALTDGYIKLKSFGMDPLNGTYQTLIDQSAALGGTQENLDGIILAVGQAWAKQKLQGEEILQLVERGVPVWELLEKATGKNAQELQKLSSSGKLGRKEIKLLLDEMQRNSMGAAAAQAQTLNGRLSNMEDAAARVARTFGEKSGFNDMISAAAKLTTDFLNSLAIDEEAKALQLFQDKLEPNLELLREFDIYIRDIDATNLGKVLATIQGAEMQGLDLDYEAELSLLAKRIKQTADSYATLNNIRAGFNESNPDFNQAIAANDADLQTLEDRLIRLSGEYTDAAQAKVDAETTMAEAANEDVFQLETAEEYGQRMYELARQAYPEATQTAEEYGEAMAKIAKQQAEDNSTAYIARMAAAEQTIRDNYTAAELLREALIKLNSQFDSGDIGPETYFRALDKIENKMIEMGGTSQMIMAEIGDSVKNWGDGLTETFVTAAMTGKLSFEELRDSIIANLLEIMFQQLIVNQLVSGISGLFTPDAAPVRTSTAIAPYASVSAQGNVFTGGNVVPFARGGLVTQPTTFPMSGGKTGLMGEAGTEAIMPLKRLSNGDLGVQSAGGSGSDVAKMEVTLNITNSGGAKEVASTNTRIDGGRLIIDAVLQDLNNSGRLDNHLTRRGLNSGGL